ncbi:hypothetical protein FRC12_001051 [Ceratobasidium sp. 428]|nr:hypothetical protein FRC12_001051 [Ceratobasidium sp. 428]
MMLLVYDHIITFGVEVELVWFKPWTWSKVLFFWNRYGTFVILLFDTIVGVGGGPSDALFALAEVPGVDRVADKHDSRKYVPSSFHTFLRLISRQVIIQVRIAAMFSQDRRVIIPMVILFFTQAIGMAAIIGDAFNSMKAVNEPVPGFRACALKGVPSRMYIYWATNLSFEAILFSLAVFKAWQNFSGRKGTRPTWSGPRILNILVRDSMLYFAVIFVTYVMNLVAWSTGGGSLYQLAIALAIALRASMGSRLLLNIREAYYTCEIVLSENPLSTIRWQQRNGDCLVMDTLPEHTTQGTLSVPGFEIDRYHNVSHLDPSSMAGSSEQARTPSKVTFDISHRID